MIRAALVLLLSSGGVAAPHAAMASSCTLDFTIHVTQGVGTILPGARLPGQAQFTTTGPTFRQGGGSTAYLATGVMTLGDTIAGPIWALTTTSNGSVVDLVGVYARDITGLSVVGVDFAGPMVVTLFGAPGSRPDTALPTAQAEWDRMDLRRSFTLHAQGYDMLAGDVTALTADCS